MRFFVKDATASGDYAKPYNAVKPPTTLRRKDIEECFVGWMAKYAPSNPKMPSPWVDYLPLKQSIDGGKTTVEGSGYVVMPNAPSGGGNSDGYFSFKDVWVQTGGERKMVSRQQEFGGDAGSAAFRDKANKPRILHGDKGS